MILFNKYRIVNMKKFKRFVFLVTLLAVIMIIGITALTKAYSMTEVKYISYYVEQGDNLWSIASGYNNNISTEELVYKISRINNISGGSVHTGDILIIPIYN